MVLLKRLDDWHNCDTSIKQEAQVTQSKQNRIKCCRHLEELLFILSKHVNHEEKQMIVVHPEIRH